MSMPDIDEGAVDIPDPERALGTAERDESAFDPGGDTPPPRDHEPGLGEDPRYDPGGAGRQPEDDEDEDRR
jgi:hypothetical protein